MFADYIIKTISSMQNHVRNQMVASIRLYDERWLSYGAFFNYMLREAKTKDLNLPEEGSFPCKLGLNRNFMVSNTIVILLL